MRVTPPVPNQCSVSCCFEAPLTSGLRWSLQSASPSAACRWTPNFFERSKSASFKQQPRCRARASPKLLKAGTLSFELAQAVERHWPMFCQLCTRFWACPSSSRGLAGKLSYWFPQESSASRQVSACSFLITPCLRRGLAAAVKRKPCHKLCNATTNIISNVNMTAASRQTAACASGNSRMAACSTCLMVDILSAGL